MQEPKLENEHLITSLNHQTIGYALSTILISSFIGCFLTGYAWNLDNIITTINKIFGYTVIISSIAIVVNILTMPDKYFTKETRHEKP